LEANLIPSFNAGIEASSNKNIKEGSASSRNFGSSIGLSYELDLWQKLANSKDAAMFEANATKFDLEASKLSVINSVSDAYFKILYLNESIKTYEQILEIYNELNKIVGLKFELGKEEALSLKQINSQLLSAQNKIESAKKELVTAKKTLRNLLNERPEFELKFEGLTLSPVKRVGVDLDVPTSAIANRPDLRAAIFRIEEGLLNYKASQKEFYPSITLGASLKSSSNTKEGAFSLKFLNGNIALNLPFLNYRKLKSNLKVSEANFELAKLNYISTLNSALNEIDAFYKGYLNDEALLINYQEQIKNYEEISKIYELKYSYGKVELKEFLEAKNSELEAKIGLLKAKYTLLQDELNIYKAMAGKFNR
jgi:tolC protein